jgi:hypothetical protein
MAGYGVRRTADNFTGSPGRSPPGRASPGVTGIAFRNRRTGDAGRRHTPHATLRLAPPRAHPRAAGEGSLDGPLAVGQQRLASACYLQPSQSAAPGTASAFNTTPDRIVPVGHPAIHLVAAHESANERSTGQRSATQRAWPGQFSGQFGEIGPQPDQPAWSARPAAVEPPACGRPGAPWSPAPQSNRLVSPPAVARWRRRGPLPIPPPSSRGGHIRTGRCARGQRRALLAPLRTPRRAPGRPAAARPGWRCGA